MKKESVDEYLARGGEVKKVKRGEDNWKSPWPKKRESIQFGNPKLPRGRIVSDKETGQ